MDKPKHRQWIQINFSFLFYQKLLQNVGYFLAISNNRKKVENKKREEPKEGETEKEKKRKKKGKIEIQIWELKEHGDSRIIGYNYGTL